MREVLAALEFSVVIDVAMTETARCADYVLPALTRSTRSGSARSSTSSSPRTSSTCALPSCDAPDGPLGEPEIHRRLVRALGALTDDDLDGPARGRGRRAGRPFAAAFGATAWPSARTSSAAGARGALRDAGADPSGRRAAPPPRSGAPRTCAPASSRSSVARRASTGGDALFDAVLARRSGVVFTARPVRGELGAGRPSRAIGISLAIPELLDELSRRWTAESAAADPDFPFVLAAGERRTSTANTIFRDPAWRKRDPRRRAADERRADARAPGRSPTARRVRVTHPRAAAPPTIVEVTDTLRAGHVTLPNGLGPRAAAARSPWALPANELTSGDQRDWLAGTPVAQARARQGRARLTRSHPRAPSLPTR